MLPPLEEMRISETDSMVVLKVAFMMISIVECFDKIQEKNPD